MTAGDSITVLRARGRRLAKIIRADGSIDVRDSFQRQALRVLRHEPTGLFEGLAAR
jgi:hypothetical protein